MCIIATSHRKRMVWMRRLKFWRGLSRRFRLEKPREQRTRRCAEREWCVCGVCVWCVCVCLIQPPTQEKDALKKTVTELQAQIVTLEKVRLSVVV